LGIRSRKEELVLPPILTDFCVYWIILTRSFFMIFQLMIYKCTEKASGLGDLSEVICCRASSIYFSITFLDSLMLSSMLISLGIFKKFY